MHNQPKFDQQRGTSFYADGRSVRPQVTGTVARGQEDAGSYFRTGMVNGAEGDGLPMPLSVELVERGQEKYNVYCTACHSRVGNGKGMIVMRGYFPAGNLHTDRLRQAPLGHFYNVISNGYGAMPDYSGQIEAGDRWAIVAYIRALQLSQHATTADAGGARVEEMSEVEKQEGFAPAFIKDWDLPMTAGVARQAAPSSAVSTPQPMPAPAAAMTTSSTAATPNATTKADPKSSPLTTAPATSGAKAPKGTPVATAVEGSAAAPTKAAPAAAMVDVAGGEKLYVANCSACHQANRQGMPPMIPSLVGIVGRVGAAHIHSVTTTGIMTGKVNMPSFTGKLTSTDVDKVIAYLAASK
ncbi:MAG: c-type cytochrome [Janthinobacterium lividum]